MPRSNDLLRLDTEPIGGTNALAPVTWADAGSWHLQNARDAWTAAKDPQTWIDAAQQYTNAMVLGTTAPKGLDPRLFVPALRLTMGGRRTVLAGKPGELHEDVIMRVADADEEAYFRSKPDLGFVNSATGRYYTREQAAQAIGVHEASQLIPDEVLRGGSQ